MSLVVEKLYHELIKEWVDCIQEEKNWDVSLLNFELLKTLEVYFNQKIKGEKKCKKTKSLQTHQLKRA